MKTLEGENSKPVTPEPNNLLLMEMAKMVRAVILIIAAVIMLGPLPVRITHAQQEQSSSGEQVVVCMIRLEHADAENLSSVLKPFLSPQGSIAAYAPTNTLIIKDRASIVDMLAEIIKGKPCTTDAPPSKSNMKPGSWAISKRRIYL